MEICKRNGFCISVSVLSDDAIEFSYYRLGQNVSEEAFYTSAASKYESSITINKENREAFLATLVEQSDYLNKNKFQDREEILNMIRLRFDLVETFDEIKQFLDEHNIHYETKQWVEFYD
ncbi:hypothetical protein BN85407390 [Alteracholeplasma palmae J233]|uniref:Uncharacterized protein n=1 Tax=Alteracholeplasma palmae (strain ATCC 49389 / J233) TaxID=1318466 RepID=U4KRN2_ALTPJ|nr:hypothetical protein [Alteracholeplasma palmae]CCV64316.1 hypothetical protein BN85407390 [Alteracholeplasma palmae J233]